MQLNESSEPSSNGVYLIPYEEFYVSELRDKVDLRKDFVRWLRASASGSSVVQSVCSASTSIFNICDSIS